MNYKEHSQEIWDRVDLLIAHCKSLLNFMYNPKEGLEEIISNVDTTKELADKLSTVVQGLNGKFTHDASVAMGIKTILTEIEYDVNKLGLAFSNIQAHVNKDTNNTLRRNEALLLSCNTVMNKIMFDMIKSNSALLEYTNNKLETSYKSLNPELENVTNPINTLYNLPQAHKDLCEYILNVQDKIKQKLEYELTAIGLLDNMDPDHNTSNIYSVIEDSSYLHKFKDVVLEPADAYFIVNDYINKIPVKEDITYFSVVEHVDDTYKEVSSKVTDTIARIRMDCDAVNEKINTYANSLNRITDLASSMSKTQITNEEYMEKINRDANNIKIFTNSILNYFNITLCNIYLLDYMSNSVNNLFLTTVNTFNMVE